MAETILVVEDEPAIRELIGFACESSGYTVLRAGSVQEASDLLSQNRVHLILLDWMLPDLSGLQWLDKLKRDERYAAVPVIMLTARGTESDKVRANSLPAYAPFCAAAAPKPKKRSPADRLPSMRLAFLPRFRANPSNSA